MTVFEAVPEIWPFDVGINLLFHGARELMEFGPTKKLKETGTRTHELLRAY